MTAITRLLAALLLATTVVACGGPADSPDDGSAESSVQLADAVGTPCASSGQCAAGEVCTTQDGVCNRPPGCGPGDICLAVCYGTCRSASSGPACGSRICPLGQVCCNASCGTCTPPGSMCTQQVCATTPTSSCKTDADCRTFSSYCQGCSCRALSAGEKDPICSGRRVYCYVDPCRGRQAYCQAGTCALRPAGSFTAE